MAQLKLSHFGDILRRRGSLQKAIMLGNADGTGKEGAQVGGGPTTGSRRHEPTEPSRAVSTGHRGCHSRTGWPGVTASSTVCNTHARTHTHVHA